MSYRTEYKKRKRGTLSPAAHREGHAMTQQGGSCPQAREGALARNRICRHLDGGLPASRTGRCHLFKPPCLWCFVLAAEQTNTLTNCESHHLSHPTPTTQSLPWPRVESLISAQVAHSEGSGWGTHLSDLHHEDPLSSSETLNSSFV